MRAQTGASPGSEGLRIRRGDVVVFDLPDSSKQGIKRIVGMPGEAVRYVEKRLSVDGNVAIKSAKTTLPATEPADLLFEQHLLDKSFNIFELYGVSLTEADSAGPGYFVLGDNRDDSFDSREFGRLAETRIRCKALAVIGTERKDWIVFNRIRLL